MARGRAATSAEAAWQQRKCRRMLRYPTLTRVATEHLVGNSIACTALLQSVLGPYACSEQGMLQSSLHPLLVCIVPACKMHIDCSINCVSKMATLFRLSMLEIQISCNVSPTMIPTNNLHKTLFGVHAQVSCFVVSPHFRFFFVVRDAA